MEAIANLRLEAHFAVAGVVVVTKRMPAIYEHLYGTKNLVFDSSEISDETIVWYNGITC